MTKVWEAAPCRENSLIILLALADWANDDGICWPSIQTLADKARVDRRSAQRIIRKLQQQHLITIEEGGGRAKQHRYQIETAALCRPLDGAQSSDIADTKTATLGAQRAALETETAALVSPDPSLTVKEPSLEPASGLPFSSKDFLEAWEDYTQARKEKRQTVTPTIQKALCKKMAEWGEKRSIAALIHSTGYTGLFENVNGNGKPDRDAPLGRTINGTKIIAHHGDWIEVEASQGGGTSPRYLTAEAFARETGRTLEEVGGTWN